MSRNVRTGHRGLVRLILGNILVIAILLFVIEGLASYSLFARDVMTTTPLAERRHTQYDPDLGWVNKPNVNIPDMYGPGISLRTNNQGFRNDQDFEAFVPAGKNRIICSGDSFTLGYGVDNDRTWCQQLAVLNPRLETVNMGQGGYGVDQAYLWYMRDGSGIEHDMQILAFITDDFYRMQRKHFLGYSKPVIKVENGALIVKNTPVPRASYMFSFFTSRMESFKQLRTVEFINKLMAKLNSSSELAMQEVNERINAETRNVLKNIFVELNNSNKQRHSKFALLYLPTSYELKDQYPEEWIDFVSQIAQAHDIPFINIMGNFRAMPYEDAVKLFIPGGKLKYPAAAGHLNEAGNETVAKIIYEILGNYLSFSQ